MNIQKAQWIASGNTVRVSVPLQKVDTENRIVSGWATLDNIDTSKDIVLASASAAAFEGFRGNIRLMHQPIPAGKLVDFREDSYYDPKTQKFYEGIYVNVYVSKGAPEVWEMVLDKTLTGFSIGGQITDSENKFVKDAGGVVRIIKAYDLIELSLVDSPANQLCDVVSITKAADGSTTVAGMVTEVVAENVFYCRSDEVAFTSTEESKACSVCNGATENIGWFESDGGDKTQKVNSLIADFTKAETVEGRENDMADAVDVTDNAEEIEAEVQDEPTPLVVDGEGPTDDSGVALGDDTEGDREDALEDALEEEEENEADDEVDAVEKTVESSEDDAFGKAFAELSDSIKKALEASTDANEVAFTQVNDKLAALGAVADKIDELASKHAELEKKFDNVTSQIENVEKRFDSVEKGVGIKKSGDLGGSKEDRVEKSTKSLWGGRFFGSVENL